MLQKYTMVQKVVQYA